MGQKKWPLAHNMPFEGYLSVPLRNELIRAAVDSDLIRIDRSLLLEGIQRTFVLGLQEAGDRLTQFMLDLNTLNSVERMENGQVPIVQFLANAAFQLKLRARAEASTFERVENQVGNRAQGVPVLPEPTRYPELQTNQAIIGFNDMVDFQFLAAGALAGQAVARLTVPRFEQGQIVRLANGRPWITSGTGWLITPSLIITNHHVINSRRQEEGTAASADFEQQARETSASFDYETGCEPTELQLVNVVASSVELDFALVQLSSPPSATPFRLFPRKLVVQSTTYQSLNIIQHPRGLTKRVALRNNLVTGADEVTIRYLTDTDLGSSGAPVCDDQWRVVALHRGAKQAENINYQGRNSAFVNFGTQIQAILDAIRTQNLSIYNDITSFQLGLSSPMLGRA